MYVIRYSSVKSYQYFFIISQKEKQEKTPPPEGEVFEKVILKTMKLIALLQDSLPPGVAM
jgi:hypothetical protein